MFVTKADPSLIPEEHSFSKNPKTQGATGGK